MEEFNYLTDDFLSNGGFQQLYTTVEYPDDIYLWDRRSMEYKCQDNMENTDLNNTNFYEINISNENNNQNYNQVPNTMICNSVNMLVQSDIGNCEYSSREYNSSSNSDQVYNSGTTANRIDTDAPNEDLLTDMDQWKLDHADDLTPINSNDWELNLDNLLFENTFDNGVPTDLPEKTFFCNDSCNLFLKESSENLNTNLQNFRPSTKLPEIAFTPSPNKRRSASIENKAPSTNCDDDKVFICTYGECKKVYAKAGHLKAHLRRHIGDKPYVCLWPNCTWKFSRSDELSRHRRSHSGIKPYKCDYCTKCFSRSDHLTKHRKVHERKMAAMKIKAVWTNLPQGRPGRRPKGLVNQ